MQFVSATLMHTLSEDLTYRSPTLYQPPDFGWKSETGSPDSCGF